MEQTVITMDNQIEQTSDIRYMPGHAAHTATHTSSSDHQEHQEHLKHIKHPLHETTIVGFSPGM
jgi:hypothetical protein